MLDSNGWYCAPGGERIRVLSTRKTRQRGCNARATGSRFAECEPWGRSVAGAVLGSGQRAGEGGRIGQAGASWAARTGDRLHACAEGGERGVDVCLRGEGTAAPCEQCRKGPARGEEDRQLRQASAGEEALSFRLPSTCQPGRPRCQRRRRPLRPCLRTNCTAMEVAERRGAYTIAVCGVLGRRCAALACAKGESGIECGCAIRAINLMWQTETR